MKLIANKAVNPHSIIQNRVMPVKSHCQVSFQKPKDWEITEDKKLQNI